MIAFCRISVYVAVFRPDGEPLRVVAVKVYGRLSERGLLIARALIFPYVNYRLIIVVVAESAFHRLYVAGELGVEIVNVHRFV